MSVSFQFLPVASALHDQTALDRLLGELRPSLAALGGVEISEVRAAANDRPLLLVALTGGSEKAMLAAWAARVEVVAWEPFLVLAHGGHNSLPAALEALARVKQDGGRGRIVYVEPTAESSWWGELSQAIADVSTRHMLACFRIGLVGPPSDWLVASTPAAEVITRRWGPQVVQIDIADVICRAEGLKSAPRELVDELVGSADGVQDVTAGDLGSSGRLAAALTRVAGDNRLDAVGVRCFDLLSSLRTSGCVALADLNDRGIMAGCEGDMPSTVAMAWAWLLLGQVPWMGNLARVDLTKNRLLVAHCTIARSLVRGYRLRSHFESGIGVAIEGDIERSPVTLLRLGGQELDRLWIAEGTVVPAPCEEGLCRTQMQVALTQGDVNDVLRDPLGNHVVVVYGHHASRLKAWWELFIGA